jgi:hypothetical protein
LLRKALIQAGKTSYTAETLYDITQKISRKYIDDTKIMSYIIAQEIIMSAKLTLSIDQNVIENAKKYAKNQKKSVSKLVEEYLSSITLPADKKIEYNALGPITKELVGIIKVNKHLDYKEILAGALMEKYR